MLRVGEDEFKALQSRINEGMRKRLDVASMAAAHGARKVEKKGRKNKYGAEATEVHGIRFDSKAEATRYLQLKALEQRGEISALRIQVSYELLPAQEVEGRKERSVHYIADFEYRDRDGVLVVEDTKSAPTKTREYVLKRKMLLYRYGIAIREVLMP